MFIYEIMNYIFLKLECHFLTMILSHLSDFSTEEEKKRMNNALAEKGLFYNTKSKCIEKIRWRAKKNCMYYYIDFNDPNSFCVASRTETFDYIDECKFNTHNYFQTEEEAKKKLSEIKLVLG